MPSTSECTCPTEHTVTKLGHGRTCASLVGRPIRDQVLAQMTAVDKPRHPALVAYECGRHEHIDGTPHDFTWATYSDDTTTYGVCRCGYDDLTHGLLTLP